MTPDQENIIRREIDRTRFWLKVDPTNKKRPYLVDWNAALEALYNEKRDLIRDRDEQWSQALWPMDVNESKDAVVEPDQAEAWMKLARGYWLTYAYECALAEDRVREIHAKTTQSVKYNGITHDYVSCAVCYDGGDVDYPCPTIRALEGR